MRLLALLGLLLLAACGSDAVGPGQRDDDDDGEEPVTCQGDHCDPDLIATRGYDAFYKKILLAGGDIPVISSALVEDAALEAAAVIIDSMLAARADVRATMVELGAYVGIMDVGEVTTDIPEHAHLKNDPNTNWDQRARGLGGTPWNPITTVGEENLLCYSEDRYLGESILVHEFAHAVHLIGINGLEEGFQAELDSVFAAARAEGLWDDTYAATNTHEYWAEGVQSWFDTNQRPQPGIHNAVDTRAELAEYDPRLHDVIARYLTDGDWSPGCGTG